MKRNSGPGSKTWCGKFASGPIHLATGIDPNANEENLRQNHIKAQARQLCLAGLLWPVVDPLAGHSIFEDLRTAQNHTFGVSSANRHGADPVASHRD